MTSDFQREERYIVVKIKDLPAMHVVKLRKYLKRKGLEDYLTECVVVESDWPIYDMVWHLVERLATGQRLPFMTDEDPDLVEVELRSRKDDLEDLKVERNALANRVEFLNQQNSAQQEQYDDLEMRYHLLANEMVYEGNSVQHWRHKAQAYKYCAGAIYKLEKLTGAETPAEVLKKVHALVAYARQVFDLASSYKYDLKRTVSIHEVIDAVLRKAPPPGIQAREIDHD